MAAIPALDELEPRGLRWVFVAPTLVYPLWHLQAPSGATDPWIAWWLVGASFSVVALISRWVPFVERNLLTWFHLCSGLVTLQMFLLAFLNDMHPFYAMGSTMAVLATLPFIRTIPNLLAYSIFVLALVSLLFAVQPDGRKLAYLAGVLVPVAALCYYRLAMQLSSERVSREHQELLEQKVRERTDELSRANQRLRAEMNERERLEQELSFSHKLEALGRLAGGVAHDFNNLLTAIGVYADLLLKSMAEGDPLRADVAQIQKAGRQASTLIQQLLTFARRRDVETKLLDVGEAVGTARSMLEHLLGEDVELVCRLDAAPQTIRANPDQLEQVLVNLTLNARDAMPDGGVFTVETRVVGAQELRSLGLDAKADAYVLLAAADTGVGMDRETRARVFDPFFTRKQVGQGTGLGLAMVYGVVTHAGGCVRVLSEPGRGARFELYWPLESEAPLHADPPESSQGAPGVGQRILLVEDESDLRAALQRVLRGTGYGVVGAESAEAALEIEASQGDFDLVVTDIVMPRMSGLELMDALRSRHPEAKILLVSGHANHPSLRDETLPPGVSLLRKPFALDDLTSKVREALGGTSAP